jgi:hypothetical protein
VVPACQNEKFKLILKILSDLEPLKGSSNKKPLYSTRSCVIVFNIISMVKRVLLATLDMTGEPKARQSPSEASKTRYHACIVEYFICSSLVNSYTNY